jgi:trehalose synthase
MGARLVQMSVSRVLGGVSEVVGTELRELARRGVQGDWTVVPTNAAVTRTGGYLLQQALGGGAPAGFGTEDARQALEAFRIEHAPTAVAAAARAQVVILHDPICAALVPALRGTKARIVWRCHLGCAEDEASRTARRILLPLLREADTLVFSRPGAVWPELSGDDRVAIVAPSIDLGSWKNRTLGDDDLAALWSRLCARGTVGSPSGDVATVDDAGTGLLTRSDSPFLLQVSRWDPVKGHPDVLRGFARLARGFPELELVLLGPHIDRRRNYAANQQLWDDLLAERARLPGHLARRTHLWRFASPRTDAEDLALNVVRRKARVVVQNSRLEGFGLTVTEAMCQGAVVVGSAVGGIVDQIEHEVNGLLTEDTGGGHAWTATVRRALTDDTGRRRWGAKAGKTVRERFRVEDSVARQLALFGLRDGERTGP